MILIRTDHTSFAAYIESLSLPARKNWRYAEKHNRDLEYKEVHFDKELCEHFMKLWASQLVRGNPIEWAFGIGHIENIHNYGNLKFFVAYKEGKPIAGHFIQKRDGYWECHPPMYDKKYNNRYLAKYMWFNLIRWAIENKEMPLDMGGGVDRWREMISTRENYPNPKYKWMYVPEHTKQNPMDEPDYYIEDNKLCLRN